MTNEIYDLRDGARGFAASSSHPSSASSRTTTSLVRGETEGATIISSAPSSSWSPSSIYDDNNHVPYVSGTINSNSALSLNPSMIDSSIIPTPSSSNALENNAPRENNNWMIELIRSIPYNGTSIASTSDISSDDIASVISSCCDDNSSYYSTLCKDAPDVFGNIGRSLMFASAASMSCQEQYNGNDHYATISKSQSGVESNWWDRLQTDEDWDLFRKKANECMNTLISQEMRRITSSPFDDKDYLDVKIDRDKSRLMNRGNPTHQVTASQGFVLWWLDGMYKSICTTIGRMLHSEEDTARNEYISALVQEIVSIQQQLERLPPSPPALPKEMALDGLPPESREAFIQYRKHLDNWQKDVMPHQERLATRYTLCQEKLLVAIIDSEKLLLCDKGHQGCEALGEVNDDGYIEVIDTKSSLWGVFVDEYTIASQRKFQFTTLSAALVAACAGFILTLQSKRGCKY